MAYNNKLLERINQNSHRLYQYYFKEIKEYADISYNILQLDLIPYWTIIAITIMMVLPTWLQEQLKFHYGNPSWWQFITSAFLHNDFNHYFSNASMFVFLVFLQLLIVIRVKEKIRYNWLLTITLFLVPIIILLVQSYYNATNATAYKTGTIGCGLSSVVYAILGFTPAILLSYYSNTLKKNFLNRNMFYIFAIYVLLGFVSSIFVFLHTIILLFLMIATLIGLIGLIIFIYIKQKANIKVLINQIVKCHLSYTSPITSTIMSILAVCFFIIPWLLLPNQIIVNGSFIDFLAHFFGMVIGLGLSFLFFSTPKY